MLAQRAGQLDRYNERMFYFYILKSRKDDQHYYGSTTNLKKRVDEHQNGKVIATKYRLPMELVYYEAFLSLGAARSRERQVKTSGSARKTLHLRINMYP